MRAAIYARYSSELQSDRSIDDQVRVCRELAARRGLDVVAVHSDAAVSGASDNRPGLQTLLDEARAGRFDVVLAEALDRLSRSLADIARLHRGLKHAGVRIVTLSEGDVKTIDVGLRGTMNELFLEDLAAKTKRGQVGRVKDGFAAGGIGYGYREIPGEPGARVIDSSQAEIVRRIFRDYGAGATPRAIAAALNREGVPAPRGGAWNASTINGNAKRRNGILHNDLYRGELVYNRQRFVKDPETGKRSARPNPPEDWLRIERPDLRLVDEAAWSAAAARQARQAGKHSSAARGPKHLLSGMARCAVCGGAYTVVGRARLGCTAHKERGTCSNGRTVAIADVERRVLAGLRDKMLAPDLLATFLAEYHAELNRRRAGAGVRQAARAAELQTVKARIRRIIDAVGEGWSTPDMKDELHALDARKRELESTPAEPAAANVVRFHPNAGEIYRRKVDALQAALTSDVAGTRAAAGQALRGLVEKIVLYPGKDREPMQIELHGDLAKMLKAAHAIEGGLAGRGLMVAGEGFVQYPTSFPITAFV